MKDNLSFDYKVMLGLFFVSFSTLLLELNLIRLFDVILTSNLAYMVISSAIFALGLAGIILSIWPIQKHPGKKLHILSIVYAFSVLIIILVLNYIPFDFTRVDDQPFSQLFFVLIFYLSLVIPFLMGGLIISTIFRELASSAQTLYFSDLSGAAVACLILAPILPHYGPGGVFLIICAFCLFAAILFYRTSLLLKLILLGISICFVIYPLLREHYVEIRGHTSKRGVLEAKEKGLIEYTRWDPVSKIEVVNEPQGRAKHIAYDGGNQSSYFYKFDGDLKTLRDRLPGAASKEFWGTKVLVSHYLKRDSGSEVLIIGSAGGQEVKAALAYNAGRVDGVELVETVINLGKNQYSKYIGSIFNHPIANIYHEEGRSFLRSSNKQYDIIQIFSNHTSSSIAQGNTALAPVYLQTAEAYTEYFEHLKPNGILHVNHHYYPRMLTTAAKGWQKLGRTRFEQHALVFETPEGNYSGSLPTLLIKMSPWNKTEIKTVQDFMAPSYSLVFNPFNLRNNIVPAKLLNDFHNELYEKAEYRLYPATDDRPYFGFIRKKLHRLDSKTSPFLDWGTANLTNDQFKGKIPLDIIHIVTVGVISILFAFLFIVIPLKFSSVGKAQWKGKALTLTYFSCLGAGFILFELTFIQLFMKFIGYPVYAYSTVLFSLLISAGLGSLLADKIGLTRGNRWIIVFLGIISLFTTFAVLYPYIFNMFQSTALHVRIFVSTIIMMPLGFFLGIPFPMGIARLGEDKKGAIPWAWGMNGLFTVIGGLLSVILSLFWGFRSTLFVAVFIYMMAFLSFVRINVARPVPR